MTNFATVKQVQYLKERVLKIATVYQDQQEKLAQISAGISALNRQLEELAPLTELLAKLKIAERITKLEVRGKSAANLAKII